uniref:Protein-serine/threonine kinase n=1 Tax=Evadne anonyx TaxID=141404 RepID=A0A9N6ZF19_9CRUS|nr:EOG090X07QN [Evadne anonyx]
MSDFEAEPNIHLPVDVSINTLSHRTGSTFTFICRNANEVHSFDFLRKELPVRLGNIMQEINLLPENLLRMPSVNTVQNWYIRSFQEMLEFEDVKIVNKAELHKFCSTLVKIRNRHADVVPTMAKGVIEMRESHQVNQTVEHRIHYFLDRFYMSRIGIRMLINQHTLLFGGHAANNRQIGCIDPKCNVQSLVRDAFENAKYLCDAYYLASPELIISEHNNKKPNSPIQIVYVPSHLYHILFELFKNSMRAVVEHHGSAARHYPPIQVLVIRGKEDVTIKISDQGGGITRSEMGFLFHYMYSTAPQPSLSGSEMAPLAGYGYGLPLSRLYARYLLGDLTVTSCEGYGTDAYISLKAISKEANEMLPVFNHSSTRYYRTPMPHSDWVSSNPAARAF